MTKEELKQKKFAFVCLGCDKNRVDGERIVFSLSDFGLKYTQNIEDAEIVVVNTCAFIGDAKQESIETIFEISNLKNKKLEKLIVTGCLAQRYYDEIKSQMPEVDAVVRIKNNDKIVDIVKGLYGVQIDDKKKKLSSLSRSISTPKHYAYLKISDGCNNCCAYCTIPKIRGRFTSEHPKKLVAEAKQLVKNGVKELILVAQDVTNYGADLFGKPVLVELIRELSKIKKLKWIRLHYCYPHLITDELISEVVNNPKVCKYLDIPMQHASDNVLKLMNRKDTLKGYSILLNKINNQSKPIALRSTFIVGFPGETKQDFANLKQFLISHPMNYVGFFKYSREEYTLADKLSNHVSERTKEQRHSEVQSIQQNIMINMQQQFVGQTMLAVVDKQEEDGSYVLRNEYNSPNVDTVIYVNSNKKLEIGEFYKVIIVDLEGIDLKGEIVWIHLTNLV